MVLVSSLKSLMNTAPIILVCVFSISVPTPGIQAGNLESSNGLEAPGLDSGCTELELGDVNGDGHPDLTAAGLNRSAFWGATRIRSLHLEMSTETDTPTSPPGTATARSTWAPAPAGIYWLRLKGQSGTAASAKVLLKR